MAGNQEHRNPLSTEEFAARLRGARGFAGMTLQQMGDLLGVSPQGLSKREKCRQEVPDPERLYFAVVICDATGLPRSWFTEPDRSLLTTRPELREDDLEPADVVDLVEQDRDGGEGSAERG